MAQGSSLGLDPQKLAELALKEQREAMLAEERAKGIVRKPVPGLDPVKVETKRG